MPRDFLIQTVGQSWIKCCSPAGIRGKLLTLDGLSSADNNHALAKVVMMFEIFGRAFRNCDGVSRRDVLKVGMLAAGGLALPDILRRKARAARAGRQVTDTAGSQMFCGGGPRQTDMYDLKPHAPAEIRGEFHEIPTNVAGYRISDQLPLQARVMDKMAIIRSVAHTTPAHGIASQWILTGHDPGRVTKDNIYPACGSIVSKLRGPHRPGMPAYIAVPRSVSLGSAA